jgi:predicted RNase H-like HicB family nuclease
MLRRKSQMRHEFTAIYERDGEWVIAYSPEVPGANGQGRTKDEARQSLADAIALILEDRREDGLRGVPADAERETILVEDRGAA